MSPDDAQHPCTALLSLGPKSEILQGTWFLGQSIGRQAFAHNFLTNKAAKCTNATAQLLDCSSDTQTSRVLFKSCTRATTTHFLAGDLCCDIDLVSPLDLSSWASTFTTLVANANHHFLSHVLNTPHPLSPRSLFMAACPAQDGGAGLWDPVSNAVAACMTPSSQSTHHSQSGVPLGSDKISHLAHHRARTNWKSEPLQLFNVLRCCPPSLHTTPG